MKVRRKVNPYCEWIVKEESTSFYIAYIAYDVDSDPMALPKADCEPVEEWVDVTGLYNGDEAMGALHSSIYKLTRHEVSKLDTQRKAYAYLLEREKV